MKVFADGGFELLSPRLLGIRFERPMQVLSDAEWNGGWIAASPGVANHQMDPGAFSCAASRLRYCEQVLQDHGLPSASTLQLTAASVGNAGRCQDVDCGVRVTAVVSAGVKHNAVWAGDDAAYTEASEREFLTAPLGTINATIFVDARLAPAVFAHVLTVVAEVKADLLRACGIRSCYSNHFATGTGTDSTVVVADAEAARCFTTASTHSGLGAALARTVRAALSEALAAEGHHAV